MTSVIRDAIFNNSFQVALFNTFLARIVLGIKILIVRIIVRVFNLKNVIKKERRLEMKLEIYCEVKVAVGERPKGQAREFCGWGQGMFFAVYRPYGQTGECGEPSPEWEVKDLQLFMGFYDKEEDVAMKPGQSKEIPMYPIKVLKVTRAKGEELEIVNWEGKKYKAQDWRTLTIESERGIFYLPDPYTRAKEIATFNGQPIVCWQ